MLHVSEACLNIIKEFEGFSSKVYNCPAGKPTIGYGHLVKQGEIFDKELSIIQATEILMDDIKWAEHTVRSYVKVFLKQNQFDALVSFVFNIGTSAFLTSTLLKKVNNELHKEVELEFLKWVFVKGKKSNGLLRRRTAEANLYRL